MTKPVAEIRPATREDMLAYSGEDKIGPSFRGIAGTLDGKVVAVAGLAYIGGRVVAYADISEEAKPYKHHIHRTARRIIREGLERHKTIYAIQDESEHTSERWLRRLGFEQMDKQLWRLTAKS